MASYDDGTIPVPLLGFESHDLSFRGVKSQAQIVTTRLVVSQLSLAFCFPPTFLFHEH